MGARLDGQNCFRKSFTSLWHIQNDQRVMGKILRYVCWGTHRPPPPPPGSLAADRLTRRPPRFGSTRGRGVPPRTAPKLPHTPRAHTLDATPPRSGEKKPMFRRNVPVSRFFSKRGSRGRGSQSQGANTPSFWLFCSWSNVETQSIAQIVKKNSHLFVTTWFLVSSMSEPATGPVVYAVVADL